MLRRLVERMRGVLQLDDPPWRIALALAVGVFISCTPTLGFQTLLGLLIATVARLNRAATVTGVWINLPWLTPFVYAGALQVGRAVVPEQSGVGGLGLMLVVGTTLIGAAAAVVTYIVSFGALSWRRRKRAVPTVGVGGVASGPDPRVGGAADVPTDREPAA